MNEQKHEKRRRIPAILSAAVVPMVLALGSCLYPTGILPHGERVSINTILPNDYVKTWEELDRELGNNAIGRYVSLNNQVWNYDIVLDATLFDDRILANGTVRNLTVMDGARFVTLINVTVTGTLRVKDNCQGFVAENSRLANVIIDSGDATMVFSRCTIDSLAGSYSSVRFQGCKDSAGNSVPASPLPPVGP
jgi:hypothetical protein